MKIQCSSLTWERIFPELTIVSYLRADNFIWTSAKWISTFRCALQWNLKQAFPFASEIRVEQVQEHRTLLSLFTKDTPPHTCISVNFYTQETTNFVPTEEVICDSPSSSWLLTLSSCSQYLSECLGTTIQRNSLDLCKIWHCPFHPLWKIKHGQLSYGHFNL